MKKRPGMEVCLLMKASGSFGASTRQEKLGWGDMKKKRKGGKEGRGGRGEERGKGKNSQPVA